jgi:C-terminal processing protease CtpA/Prc
MQTLTTAASTDARSSVLTTLLAVYEQRVYDPIHRDSLRPMLEANWNELLDAPEFEAAVQELLNKIGIYPLRLEHESTRRIEVRRLLSTTFYPLQEPGPVWIFQDVHPHGVAAKNGIKPGDTLREINGVVARPPVEPAVPSNGISRLVCGDGDKIRTIEIDPASQTARPAPGWRYWLFHREPHRYAHSQIFENGIGYVRVSEFPGLVGVEMAHQIDQSFRLVRRCRGLIVDIRGNPGGGTANLRLMTHLTPERIPVGYSLTRRRSESGYRREELPQFMRIPRSRMILPFVVWKYRKLDKSIVVVTEGRRPRPYDGRIVMLVNEHTTSGAEIVAGFAADHHLATLVGARTRGRMLGFSRFPIGHGYFLTVPVSNYVTWEGKTFERSGVVPHVEVPFTADEARAGRDYQLERAVAVLS